MIHTRTTTNATIASATKKKQPIATDEPDPSRGMSSRLGLLGEPVPSVLKVRLS